MKKKMYLFLLSMVICLIACQKEELKELPHIQDSTIHLRNFESLCFTSYNIGAFCEESIFGFSIHNTVGDPDEYAQNICDVLKEIDSDVINLQEVWCSDVQEAIIECMGGDEVNFVYDHSSGLLTISKLPITDQEMVNFEGPETGLDQIKDKGFLSIQIGTECCSFNVINTHLQADLTDLDHVYNNFMSIGLKWLKVNTSDTESIRDRELAQIKSHLDLLSDCVPTLIGGDFNVDVGTDQFRELISLLQGQPTNLVSSSPTSVTSGTTLDYFILNNYASHEHNIGSITTTVFDCSEPEIVVRWNVIESIFSEEHNREFLVGSFDTFLEASEFAQNANQEEGIHRRVEREETEVCIIENVSDHHPIETCIDEYDCSQQLDCEEEENILNLFCNPPCNFGDICLDGVCVSP